MRTAAIAVLLAAAAPAVAQSSARDRGDLAVLARAILKRHCAECHGEAPRRGDVSVLDYPKLAAPAYPVPILNPADPPRSLVLQLVRDGSMPPGGRPGLAGHEVKALEDWIKAGAPGYPRAFTDRFAAEAARADWEARPAAEKPRLRYLSFAHQFHDALTPPGLRDGETKLRAALRAAAGRDVPLTPVDPAATVFRLDLRDADWDRGDRFDRVVKGAATDAHPLTPFDVVMLEYPQPPPEPPAAVIADGLAGVRKVPVVRADWLTRALAPNTPLTNDVRSLADLKPDLDPGKEPCGPRPGRFFAGEGVPGRPLESWHAGDPDVTRFRFTAEVVTGKDFDQPTAEVVPGDKHKLRLTSDRPARVRVLRVLADGDAQPQPLERDAVSAGATLVGPRANVALVAGNVSGGGAAETDYYVVFAAEEEVPVPTILRSRHLQLCDDPTRFPVSRFVFDADPKFDPSRVVRRVVPLTVRKP